MLNLCRVFLFYLSGHSEQLTKAALLSEKDVPLDPVARCSDGMSQTVLVQLYRDSGREGERSRDRAHGMISAFPTYSMNFLCHMGDATSSNYIFVVYTELTLATSNMPYRMHSYLARTRVHHTHFVEYVDHSFSGDIEFCGYRISTSADAMLSMG